MAQLGYVRRPGKTTLSYSKLLTLHTCPRKAQVQELEERTSFGATVHTTYGHAFGAGIQSLFSTNGNLEHAYLAAFQAWEVALDDCIAKDKKSLWFCLHQLSLWHEFEYPNFADWTLAPNGVELLFLIEISPAYDYQGHIDIVLQHRETGELAVAEIKTTNREISRATYENSNQTGGYQVVLNAMAAQLSVSNSRKVFYIVAQPKYMLSHEHNFGFNTLPFTKTLDDNITFLHGILLDIKQIEMYREANHFPKRGEACESYGRPCHFFGTCDTLVNSVFNPDTDGGLAYQALDMSAVNCLVSLDNVIEQMHHRLSLDDNPNAHLDDITF